MSEDDSVKHEGKWTRADLPSWDKIRDADDMAGNGLRFHIINIALNEVVEHLNTHHPKPERDFSGVDWRAMYLESCSERDEWKARADQLRDERDDAVQSCMAVGRERDAAIARAEAHAKGATRANLDRDTAYEELADMTNRAEAAEKELGQVREELGRAYSRTDKAYAERDKAWGAISEWKARAEKAEADRENIAEEFADFRAEVVAEAVKHRESHPHESNADPVVYAVRESDIAAVEVAHDERGWHARGATWSREPTAEGVRDGAKRYLRDVAQYEALARAIEAEQAVDPVEAKAIELHRVAYGGRIGFGHATLNAQEMFRSLARYVLEQEADYV